MSNFSFLKEKPQFKAFASEAVEAENLYHVSPAACTTFVRKAVEFAVRWQYTVEGLEIPPKANLATLIYNPDFKDLLDEGVWQDIVFIRKQGNGSTHESSDKMTQRYAVLAMKALFDYVCCLDYMYSPEYEVRHFSEKEIPAGIPAVDPRVKDLEKELEKLQADLRLAALEKEQLTAQRQESEKTRQLPPRALTEAETRENLINLDLRQAGWIPGSENCREEVPSYDESHNLLRSDYVLYGAEGKPIAIVEAKRVGRTLSDGYTQTMEYADALYNQYGIHPILFLTNGFETEIWEYPYSAEHRRIGGIYNQDDLLRLIQRRTMNQARPTTLEVDEEIAGRDYQIKAIKAALYDMEQGKRRFLFVMATGTGKTRTAAAMVEVLSRGGYVKNVLFLADRIALVTQAKDAFARYLPSMSLCNLMKERDQAASARIVFSTYQTIMGVIGSPGDQTQPLFSTGHFDLIIIDESHRSIFRKYRAIFDYFDAMMLGLTATPRDDVDSSTYDFFRRKTGDPTALYDYETAVYKDHYLVPFKSVEVNTKLMTEGIVYANLSKEDKERYEDAFTEEDGTIPDRIDSADLNRYVFDQNTVDIVLTELMEKGIHIAGGTRLAKTIIFAQTKRHAEYILERFNALFQERPGFCQLAVYGDDHAQEVIRKFRQPEVDEHHHWTSEQEVNPQIVVSVDMMDTGVDVPQLCNLVFFKKVYSKIKFWQMIGRGTRLCKDMVLYDGENGEYQEKQYFYIFDYCGNFKFFGEHPEGVKATRGPKLTELLFAKRVYLVSTLQQEAFQQSDLQEFRQNLIRGLTRDVKALNMELGGIRAYGEAIYRFSAEEAYEHLTDEDVEVLTRTIAPLIEIDDSDVPALRFDYTIYSIMIAALEGKDYERPDIDGVIVRATKLKDKGGIPEVERQMESVQRAANPNFWSQGKVLDMEEIRGKLRGLIKFIPSREETISYVNITDTIVNVVKNRELGKADTYHAYRERVDQYVNEHRNHTAIYKLTHNIPLTDADFDGLQQILMSELGSAQDYDDAFGPQPLGLTVRKLAHMDEASVKEAFADFLNTHAMNPQQMAFMDTLINYVIQNGCVQDEAELMGTAFTKAGSVINLFPEETYDQMVNVLNGIRNNAIKEA